MDARVLAYTDIGQSGRPCVLFFQGAPSSRPRLTYLENEFEAAGVRVISPDRPSYGRSSPQPGRSMADWPHDVAALADALGIERFAVAGHSSGGPYAVACAAVLSDRVSGLVTLGGVTDIGWPAAWECYIESELELMRMPDEESVLAWCVEHFGEDGSRFMSASGMDQPEADLPLYEDERIASMLAAARAEAFRQCFGGYAQDVFHPGPPMAVRSGACHRTHADSSKGEGDTLLPMTHPRTPQTWFRERRFVCSRNTATSPSLASSPASPPGSRPEWALGSDSPSRAGSENDAEMQACPQAHGPVRAPAGGERDVIAARE